MWVPALPASGTPTGGRNASVGIPDVLATLVWSGTSSGGPPNASGRDYDSDVNANGVLDGVEYDRTPGMVAGVSAAPNKAVGIPDVLVVLAQSGQSC